MNTKELQFLNAALGVVFTLITSGEELKELGDLFNRARAEGRDLSPMEVEKYLKASKSAREEFDASQ